MDIGLDEIRQLVSLITGSDLSELTVEAGDVKIAIKKGSPLLVTSGAVAAQTLLPVPPPAPAEATPVTPAERTDDSIYKVRAPMVGTFYRAPSPDSPPFVEVGTSIEPGQTLCIIEAMKLMNQIEAENGGRVRRILVNNGEPVDFGQVLMEVER